MSDHFTTLLDDALISVAPDRKTSLPGVLGALARDEVQGFPAMRPHQRAAWHMFLVQLSALALWRAGLTDLPEEDGAWRNLLLGLTEGDPEPWALVQPRDRPAFMQPPAPDGLKWTEVPTPDALDILITARNHDLKREIATAAEPEDWVFALVALQTLEGYGGAGNYGIARMNGGSSSRPMLGLAPVSRHGDGPDPCRWWRRDVAKLLVLRSTGEQTAPGTPGGPGLLWRLPWPERQSLDLTTLDPWFIEVCRRVRLEAGPDGLSARRTTSKAARIAAKTFNGVTGDPWAPVSADTTPRSLTLAERSFDYSLLCELLFSGNWHLPPLCVPGGTDRECVLVAEALARGNSRTYGLQVRAIPVSSGVIRLFRSKDAGDIAREQMNEITVFDEALRDALALVAARGERSGVDRAAYARTQPARQHFDRSADALFFPSLWGRLEAHAGAGAEAEEAARRAFLRDLLDAARAELEAAIPAIPCASIDRPRAEARARRAFTGRVRRGIQKTGDFAFLFERETADA
jgi:CRISPR system Cascade subunit CasA